MCQSRKERWNITNAIRLVRNSFKQCFSELIICRSFGMLWIWQLLLQAGNKEKKESVISKLIKFSTPVRRYLPKVNNRKIREIWGMCSKFLSLNHSAHTPNVVVINSTYVLFPGYLNHTLHQSKMKLIDIS